MNSATSGEERDKWLEEHPGLPVFSGLSEAQKEWLRRRRGCMYGMSDVTPWGATRPTLARFYYDHAAECEACSEGLLEVAEAETHPVMTDEEQPVQSQDTIDRETAVDTFISIMKEHVENGHSEGDLDVMIEHLYCLDRWQLRRLAWEALLIADGPDRVVHIGSEHIDDTPVCVEYSANTIWQFKLHCHGEQ